MAHLPRHFQINHIGQRTLRFLTVGATGTLLDLALFTILRGLLGVPTLAANTISYSAGIINNYGLHRHWTFADRSHEAVGAQFSRFVLVSLNALLLNNLLVLWLAPYLGSLLGNATLGELSAKICATGVGLCWNFLANNFWTFRGMRGAHE